MYTTIIYPRFSAACLDDFQALTDSHADLLAAVKEGIEKGFRKNIIVSGNVGTGKTFLAYAILNALGEKIETPRGDYIQSPVVLYRELKRIIDDIKASFSGGGEFFSLEDEKKVPLLILDEVGLQYGTDSERIELFEIFNTRYGRLLPTICLSNLKRESLLRVLGSRICDRLFGDGLYFELNAPSMRGRA